MSDALAPLFPPSAGEPVNPPQARQRKTRQKRAAPPEAPVIEAKKNRGRPRKVAVHPVRFVVAKPTDWGPKEAELMVPMSAMVGITADELGVLSKTITLLNTLPKKSRGKVAQALGRIFA